jgi:hypothetical protein
MRCRGTAFLDGEAVDPDRYRGLVRKVSGTERIRGPRRIRWVVLEEAHRLPGTGSGGGEARLPGWMWHCWNLLDSRELPETVSSATALLEAELGGHPEYLRVGNGLHLRLSGRSVFLGRGEGGVFRRVGRPGPDPGPDLTDWLRQTRTLFRNRTGSDLKRVYLTGLKPAGPEMDSPVPFEIIGGVVPAAWRSRSDGQLGMGDLFVHLAAVRQEPQPAAGIPFAGLGKRSRLWQWERRLRMAVGGVMGCWMLVVLGACQMDGNQPLARAGPGEREHWRQIESRLEAYYRDYSRDKSRSLSRERPFRLVGDLASHKPGTIEVSRIRLDWQPGSGGQECRLYLEGDYRGSEPSAAFRRWVEALKLENPALSVAELDLERREDRIGFAMSGSTGRRGTEP